MDGVASHYARQLLEDLGVAALYLTTQTPTPNPLRWQQSGLAALTGAPDAAVAQCPVPIASLADGALGALCLLAGRDILPQHTGAGLLTVRAEMSGLTRHGAISAGGSCRILACKDGHLAVNLARESDWALLEAWLREPVAKEWTAVAQQLRKRTGRDLIDQARLLGLAVANAEPVPGNHTAWFELCHTGRKASPQQRTARVLAPPQF